MRRIGRPCKVLLPEWQPSSVRPLTLYVNSPRASSRNRTNWNVKGCCLKSRRSMFLLVLSIGLVAFGQDAVVPSTTQQLDPIAGYLQPLVDNHTIAGAVTLVATKDRTVYLKPIGFRDLRSKAPMPANAMFWIASTSKPMTVTAVMMLVDEGKIHLDDPVEKYLPEFKGQLVRVD